MSTPHQLTHEELALSRERKLKNQLAKKQASEKEKHDPRGNILPRQWLKIRDLSAGDSVMPTVNTVKVMSWNLLAQCLIRRELFPTSDCLKAAQREHMLYREILDLNADICCLQEVDRTEKLCPVLENAGYAHVYSAGPRKKHGCMIAYRNNAFSTIGTRTVFYDDEVIRSHDVEDERMRKASTRVTKNIANIVALKRISDCHQNEGIVVATTHLFWHPRYTYERARQAGILLREVDRFRTEMGHPDWPCVIAGDFNFQPDDVVYSLMMGDPPLPEQLANIDASRVIHVTRDPTVTYTTPATLAEEAEDEESDPDKVITNARKAEPKDDLLSNTELLELFHRSRLPVSAYDDGLEQLLDDPGRGVRELTYGSRVTVPPNRHGANEPVWTSYTHYWKTVLDYIFILDSPSAPVSIVSLANPHTADKLNGGLPRKGICGSDHISLGAELAWPTSDNSVELR